MATYSHLERPKTSSTSATSYALNNSMWGGTSIGTPPAMPITYSFTPQFGGSEITNSIHKQAVRDAFDDWSAVSNLQFTELATGSDADIDLYFQSIDGLNGTLGQAIRTFTDTSSVIEQILNAEVEFDSADMASSDYQIFYLVTLHEVGHALGLGHVDDPNQIMFTFYTGDHQGLGPGDIAGMHELYGPAAGSGTGYSFGGTTDDTIDTRTQTDDMSIYGNPGDDTILSGVGADTILGGIGTDVARGGAGRDLIMDSFGDDTLSGEDGEDNLYSPDGRNHLDGGAGNDALRGGISNDRLIGGTGDDALIADDTTASRLFFGDDTLDGGAGDDSLEGGSGRDVFIFDPSDGTDIIGKIDFDVNSGFSIRRGAADFTPGEDLVDLRSFGFASASEVLAALSSSGGNAIFAASGTQITFEGVDQADLSINDFLWS